jgi:hypothetical protein
MAQFIARVYESETHFCGVVKGLGSVEVDRLDRAEEAARSPILDRILASYPMRGEPWEDPGSRALYEFEVEI